MTLSASVHKRLATGFALDISISVPPGITIVFGPSGCGKTTLLRCVSGLMKPDRGRIAVGDRMLFDSAKRLDVPPPRRRVGYVFQHLALFPHLTIEQNLHYGMSNVEPSRARSHVGRIAESFHINHLLGRRPADVSGGERQRAALARSLVTDPSVLLLDEPLSALDHRTQSLIIDDLRQWTDARQIPILYVTHAHREVFALGERVIVMDEGRVVAEGSPHDVMDTPSSELVAQLAGFENLFQADVTAVSAEAGTMHCHVTGTSVELEVPLLTRAQRGLRVRLAIRAGDILVATEEPRGLSARNVLTGVIASLRHAGTTVISHVDAGALFEVHLTPSACHSLRLSKGDPVWLVIKTHSCRAVSL